MASHLRILLSILVTLLLHTVTIQAQTLGVTSVTPNPVCAGSTIVASYTYSAADPGTLFLYLNGPGTTDVLLNVAASTGGNGSITAPIPTDRATGTYTVRIIRISGTTGTINSPNSSGFTINALPAAPGVTNISYCVGTTGVPPLTATGQNLKWYTNSSGGAGTSIAPTPPTSTTGTTNYYVSQTDGNGCESPRATLPVTINPLPAKPTVVSSLSYCQNAAAPSLAAAVTSGSNLKWYTSANGGAGSTVATVPSTSGVGSITYYVSQTNGNGCESDRADITVTTKAIPNPPSVTTPVIYCQNAVASPLSATTGSGGTLNWYGPSNNALGSTAPTPPTSSPGTTFYSVSQTISGCESSKATITVTINTRPNAPTTTPVGVCQNTTPVSLATGVTATGTLKWYTGSSGGAGSTVAPTPPTTSVGSTPYYVTQTDGNGCESDRAVLTFTVYAYPTAPTVSSSPIIYCQGSTATPLSATSAPGATLSYYDIPTGGTPYGSLTPSTTTSNNYYVSQTVSGCESQRATITVSINALPPKPATITPLVYCQLATAAPLSATANTNYTLYWYGTDATGGNASTVIPTPSTTSAGSFHYYVTQRDPIGCESLRADISVTINAKPAAPTTTPASACLNSVPNSLTSSITATGTLKWYTAPNGGIGSTVTPTLSTTATGSITYYVSQTSGDGCESDRASITFTVNPLPAAPTLASHFQFYCQNATASSLTATGTNLKWYTTNVNGTALPNPVIPSTTSTGPPVTYYVSQTDANGCESQRDYVVVTISSRPGPPTVSSTPITYCQYATPVSLSATAISGNSLLWYGPNETGGTASTTATVPSTNAQGTTQYYVSQSDGNGCESSTRVFITVNVNPKPVAPTTVTISICQNSTSGSFSSGVTATGTLTWYTSVTGGTGSTVSPTFSTSAVGSTTYYVSQTNGSSCESDRATITAIINPLPSPTLISSGTLTCATPSVSLTASGGTSYNFSGAAIISQNATSGIAVVNAVGLYSVLVTNVNSCTAIQTIQVFSNTTVPTATLTNSGPLTTNSHSSTLTAGGGSSYAFGGPGIVSQNSVSGTAVANVSGTYSVTVTSSNGCSTTASIGLPGTDLTPSLYLPQAYFPSLGSVNNFLVNVFEVGGLPTSAGNVTITITAPSGYALTFSPTLTSITVSGGDPNPVAVNNSQWSLTQALENRQFTLVMNGQQFIGAGGTASIGLSITRTTANSGSLANITVNVADNPMLNYDGNLANNVYARIINGL